jgi:hypothetical protein
MVVKIMSFVYSTKRNHCLLNSQDSFTDTID